MPKRPTRKAGKSDEPQKLPRPRKRYSPDAEMADILYRAAQQPQPERIQDLLTRLRSATTAPSSPARRKSRAGSGPLLFSEQQMKEAKTFYRDKLDGTEQAMPPFRKKENDPKYWRNHKLAAMHIATEVLGLKVGNWQTVNMWIVKPVLLEWKAARQPIKPRKNNAKK
jgi:hypothetical protein